MILFRFFAPVDLGDIAGALLHILWRRITCRKLYARHVAADKMATSRQCPPLICTSWPQLQTRPQAKAKPNPNPNGKPKNKSFSMATLDFGIFVACSASY